MTATTARPLQEPTSAATDFQQLQFFVLQRLARIKTCTVVKVQAVHPPLGVLVGKVDVLPLVGQVDGAGNVIPHKTLFRRPYLRVQGGTNAIIMDPAVGDIGVMVFAARDISSAVASGALSPPASGRTYSYADGLYLLSLASGTPTQKIDFTGGNIAITTPHQLTISAAGGVNINGAQISAAGEVTDALGKVLGTHEHGGVTTGTGTSGPPV